MGPLLFKHSTHKGRYNFMHIPKSDEMQVPCDFQN